MEGKEDKKVWLRLIPRPDSNVRQVSYFKKAYKPPQRVGWRPETGGESFHPFLNMPCMEHKKSYYANGFVFKPFNFKHIDSAPNIKPSHEEL
jgi:hypothetical protein